MKRLLKLKKKKKTKNNLKNYFINYQSPSDMYKKLRDTEGKKNEDRVEAIKKMLDKMKENMLIQEQFNKLFLLVK